jgi:hypothetical protein
MLSIDEIPWAELMKKSASRKIFSLYTSGLNGG